MDKLRLKRPVEAATSEIIEKVHDMILNDRRVKVREIAAVVGISYEVCPESIGPIFIFPSHSVRATFAGHERQQ